MEWCRMYRLNIVFCYFVLLGFELATGVTDSERDSLNIFSDRDKKLQDLLKSLESQSNQTSQNMPSEQRYSHPSFTWTIPPFIKPPKTTEKIMADDTSDSFESEIKEIQDYEEYYRKMYGTREGVHFLKQKYGPTGLERARAKFPRVNKGVNDVKRANNHYLEMNRHAQCDAPVPRVIKVKTYYSDPSKVYKPRCTILHRCGDETGCCKSDAEHCVPKNIQVVILYFYTFSIGKNGPKSKVERLLFENHTACHCQPINDLPRMVKPEQNPLDGEDNSPKSKCRDCPVPFTKRMYEDGRCECDCFDGQKPCLRIKRGRDSLSRIERQCVEANHCNIPDCAYGVYNPTTGFCPKKNDDLARNNAKRPHPYSHRCRDCPVPFTAHVYKDGRCGCICLDNQMSCLRIRQGRDKLAEIERRCVEANQCHIPDCEHGTFDSITGYCPHKFEEVSKNHQRKSRPLHHRYAFFERD